MVTIYNQTMSEEKLEALLEWYSKKFADDGRPSIQEWLKTWTDLMELKPDGTLKCKEDVIMFKHNCKNCVSLGQYDKYDLYYCPDSIVGGGSVVARFGNEPHEYLSSPKSCIAHHIKAYAKENPTYPLLVAYRRAYKKELITIKEVIKDLDERIDHYRQVCKVKSLCDGVKINIEEEVKQETQRLLHLLLED